MDRINSILSFLKYFVKAKSIHAIHSPFLFDLLSKCFDHQRNYYIFEEIEPLRSQLLRDKRTVERIDYGAGSSIGKTTRHSIKQIAKTALSPAKQCRSMFRLIDFLKAKNILEMGTSLGVSTLYLAADPSRKVTALEGDPGLIKIAKDLAHQLRFKNIDFRTGPFSETLPKVIQDAVPMDVIFMDGHHEKKPTIEYFETLQPLITEQTVVIVDDIHWSKGMEEAWEVLKSHERVTQSIDLFYYGLLFFRTEFLNREHHVFKV